MSRRLLPAATLPTAFILISYAAADPAVPPGVPTGTTVATTTPATGAPSTVTTTTYVSGPSAVSAQAAAAAAQANLQTSLAQARAAQIAATNSLLPASGTSGTVTLQTGAGTEESNVLAAVAINAAAARINAKLNGESGFLIVTGTSLPDFSGWLSFDAKLTFLKNQFDKAENDYGAAEALPPVALKVQDITGIGEAASSLVKLAQLAATDWTAGGIALQTDDYMLAIALSSRNTTATIYNQSTSIDVYQDIQKRLGDVDAARQLAARNSTAAAAESASLKAQAKPASPANNAKKSAALDATVAELNSAVTAYDAYLGQLSGAAPVTAPVPAAAAAAGGTTPAPSAALSSNSSNSVTLAAILQQKSGYDASKAGGVLLLRVHSASGGLYTEKNLWSSFGAMPFYASGGAVVSYSFVKGGTRSAGLLEVVVPYNKVTKVKTIADLDYKGLCNQEPPAGDSKLTQYKKYCP
jgi:hypothetical protein